VPQSSGPVERRLAKILRERKEPHGKLLKGKEILKGVEISEGGIVELWITPTHLDNSNSSLLSLLCERFN